MKDLGIPHGCEDDDHDACLERECFCPCHLIPDDEEESS